MKQFLLSIFFLCFLALPSYAADFGDAPDNGPTGYPNPLFPQTGQFPSLAANNGANTDNLMQATLGPDATDEPDALITNADADDGIVNFVVLPISIPAPAVMTVNVNGPATSTGGMFFVNVLIDMNMNGTWDGVIGPGVTEWAVQNFPVIVAPGVDQDVTLPPFIFANGNRLPDGAWMRIALTDAAIPATPSWDGSGTFAAGEVEDHVIDLPQLAGPGGGPRKSCVPTMICPQVVKLPADGSPRNFACAILNQGTNDQCTFNYTMNRATPGADASDVGALAGTCAVNGPVNIGLCGPTGQIAPAPLGLLLFAPMHVEVFQGNKNGDLPSVWTYLATYNDPQAVVTKEGVTVGYQDSFGATQFVTDEEIIEEKEIYKLDLEQLKEVKDFMTLKKLGVTIPEIFDVDPEKQKQILELYSPENIQKYQEKSQKPEEPKKEKKGE